MFKIKSHPFISMIEDGEGGGGGESEISESPELTFTDSSSESNDSGHNPAWNELLDTVPEEFHKHMLPHLQGWDKGVQERFQTVQQQYAPFKEFLDRKVSMEDLNAGLNALVNLRNDPRGFYDAIGNHFKFVQNSQGPQEEAGDEEEFDVDGDITKNPAFKAIQDKLTNQEKFINSFQQSQAQAQADAQVKQEMDAVKAKYPDMDLSMVATFASGMAQNGIMPNLGEVADYIASKIPQPRASDSAPPVVKAGNRSFNTVEKKFGDMTDEERAAYIQQKANS